MPVPRVIFFGSGEIAIPSFERLIKEGPRPVALVTQPDKPAGRHRVLTAPPIKQIAVEAGIPVLQPESVRDESSLAELRALAPDLIVVMAYGQLLPKKLLKIPKIACINLHGSLLPRHRGASCVQAAILAGDAETGVTVMHVAPKLDSGDIILSRSTPIVADDTGGSVHDRLAVVAAEALVAAVPLILAGTAPREIQDDSLANYAPKLERDDGRIDWSRSAAEIELQVRAYDPWPGTWCWLEDNGEKKRFKVLSGLPGSEPAEGEAGSLNLLEGGGVAITCGSGAYQLKEIQPDGGKRMPVEQWARGLRPDHRYRLS
ncbi:MAG: methionyl-tRNA formyltransferase [Akkermansiaceae bacterium]|nr:methionyl-tRNA formyltransferase [Akkermansiaceae bacterium]